MTPHRSRDFSPVQCEADALPPPHPEPGLKSRNNVRLKPHYRNRDPVFRGLRLDEGNLCAFLPDKIETIFRGYSSFEERSGEAIFCGLI